jgi:LysM repeat protein
MNNPNPFVPKGSLLEQQSHRRSRLKLAVGCVLAVSVTGLVVMLIQGCKREAPETPTVDTNAPALEATNLPPADNGSNAPAAMPNTAAPSNTVAMPTPMVPPPAVPQVAPPAEPAPAAGSEYIVAQGDTLAKIAKTQGVTLSALKAANPGVDPKKLKIKQKLVIPGKSADATGAAATTTTSTSASVAPEATGGESYTVKSGDTLSKIAKRHGISLKALKAANSLSTDHIKVGDKLKIPAKAESAAAAASPTDTTAAPVVPPVAPPPAPVAPVATPAPGH